MKNSSGSFGWLCRNACLKLGWVLKSDDLEISATQIAKLFFVVFDFPVMSYPRKLLGFVPSRPDRGGDNDIRAREYVKQRFRPRKSREIVDAEKKLKGQIFHSSAERTDKPEGKFDTSLATEVLKWLDEGLEEFTEVLKPCFPKDWMPQRPAHFDWLTDGSRTSSKSQDTKWDNNHTSTEGIKSGPVTILPDKSKG